MTKEYSVRAVHCNHRDSDEKVYEALLRATEPLERSWQKLEKAGRIVLKLSLIHI